MNIKISEMDYTSRLRGDDVFPLVQDGENKVISADDLMENIGNAIENQHHKHHCCHENPEIELDEIKCQAAKASLDSKEAKALALDALSIGKEALEQSDLALDLAARANDKANAALKETDKISTIEDNITILTSLTNLNTKGLQLEISDRKDGDNNLQKQIDNLSSSTTYAATYTGDSLNSSSIIIPAATHTLGEYVFVQVFMNGLEITPNIFNENGKITIYGDSGSGTSWKTTDTVLVLLIKVTEINNSYN